MLKGAFWVQNVELCTNGPAIRTIQGANGVSIRIQGLSERTGHTNGLASSMALLHEWLSQSYNSPYDWVTQSYEL